MWAQFQIRQYLDMNGLDGVIDRWGKYLDRYGWEVSGTYITDDFKILFFSPTPSLSLIQVSFLTITRH